MASTGTVIQVIGSTFDAQFAENELPAIYNAVTCEIEFGGEKTTLVGEVARHMGEIDRAAVSAMKRLYWAGMAGAAADAKVVEDEGSDDAERQD